MCGIIGAVNIGVDASILRSLQHRGPDSQGSLQEDIKGSSIFLGHTRLAIQDLSPAGHQPMTTACGRYTIVFNGEIYNHLDLRSRLDNVHFTGHSDTETLIQFLMRYSLDAISQLNGIFAFALLDRKTAQIHLVRDMFGVKPLYYHLGHDSFAFSSEVRGLKALGIPINLATENIGMFFRLRFCPSPMTLYKNIQRLEPGTILTYDISSGSVSQTSFQSFPDIDQTIRIADALERYEFYLRRAVRRQLVADVPVALLLSGGVDSALLALLSMDEGKAIDCYTAGYATQTDANELEHAKLTAQHLGANHHEVILNENDFLDSFPRLLSQLEEPVGSQSIFPLWFISERMNKDGFKVALTGQGVDEVWGGYRRYNGQEIFEWLANYTPSSVANRMGDGLKNDNLRRVLRSLSGRDRAERFVASYSAFDESMQKRLFRDADLVDESRTTDWLRQRISSFGLSQRSATMTMMAMDARLGLADDLLLYTDKMTMAHSIEARVPFLDLELVQFAESLPQHVKVGMFSNKRLHKSLSAKLLSSEIAHRKKKGFYTPIREWLQGEKGHVIQDALLSQSGALFDILSKDYVGSMFEQHRRGVANFEKQLYLILSFSTWITTSLAH